MVWGCLTGSNEGLWGRKGRGEGCPLGRDSRREVGPGGMGSRLRGQCKVTWAEGPGVGRAAGHQVPAERSWDGSRSWGRTWGFGPGPQAQAPWRTPPPPLLPLAAEPWAEGKTEGTMVAGAMLNVCRPPCPTWAAGQKQTLVGGSSGPGGHLV